MGSEHGPAYRPDMSAQKAPVCHARFVQDVDAGGHAHFLVLMTAGDCPDASVQADVIDGGIAAAVTAWGKTDRVALK